MKNLAEVQLKEQKDFFKSFEQIFCDMDGVIWLNYIPIPGAQVCINHLKQIGKRVVFITNNVFTKSEVIRSKLVENKFEEDEVVINPTWAMIAYLKRINFDKQIYVVGTSPFKEELKKAGLSLAPDPPDHVADDTFEEFTENTKDDPSIGAVIYGFDMNLSLMKLQRVLTYIKRKDCLFIVGGGNREIIMEDGVGPFIGSKHFFDILTDLSQREYVQLAKPSLQFVEFVLKECNIQDPKTVLFIGDSIPADMAYAEKAGFQKLLVLTGSTEKDDLLNWKYPEEWKPQYYVESLNVLSNILKNVYQI